MSSEQSEVTADAVAAPVEAGEVDAVDAGIDGSAEVAQLRAQLAESERKNAYLKAGFVEAKKPHWVAEQQRLHPELAVLLGKEAFQSIEASSRRDYERKVLELKETHAPTIGRLQALRVEAAARVETAREEAVQAARAEVQAAWGRPALELAGAAPPDPKADTLKRLVDG